MRKANDDNFIKSQEYKEYYRRVVILVVADIISIALSYFLALWLRFDFHFSEIPEEHITNLLHFVPAVVVISLIIYYFLHLYNSIWRYISVVEANHVLIAYVLIGICAVLLIMIPFFRVPLSCLIIGYLLSGASCVGLRFGYRLLRYVQSTRISGAHHVNAPTENILLVGAGQAARLLIRELKTNQDIHYHICAIADQNPTKQDRYLEGVRIEGAWADIPELAEKHGIHRIIICLPQATQKELTELISICKETGCRIQSIPDMYQILRGEISISHIRDVDINDLLSREEITVNTDEIKQDLSGKTVLVTGGGGSIGSELCRQIAAAGAGQLIVFDIYENSVYELEQELTQKYPDLHLHVLIGSVRNEQRVRSILDTYRPDIIYHAAAHKHVPLMEDSPNEAIKNNVIGTKITAEAAADHGVQRFVLISSDKAVNPTNVMGASKRICEMIIQMMSRKHPDTVFTAVRFGNVLGSNGSVVPLFRHQIEQGGPVTVTDPRAVRYFMTIPEAVSLVLQAGYYAKNGEIFILDMGEPIRVLDLAENLIQLSGFRPYKDIPIEFTGLRKGEKLYEELLIAEEGLRETANKSILVSRPIEQDDAALEQNLLRLSQAADSESDRIKEMLAEILPSYEGAL